MHEILETGRRQRKRQALHHTLLTAADTLFHERGIAGTTVDDIAEAADVARQTVFNHFPYKEAFVLELTSTGISTIAQRAHALLETGVPALEVLQRAGGWVIDLANEDHEAAIIVARELLHSDSERAARAAEYIPLERLFGAILEQAREEGGVREDLPMDVVAERLSCSITTMIAKIAHGDITVLRRNLCICFDMVFHGIIERSA